jgi:hypothetical protein
MIGNCTDLVQDCIWSEELEGKLLMRSVDQRCLNIWLKLDIYSVTHCKRDL